MTQYIQFPHELDKPSRWGSQEIPKHTQESLENYLINGYHPGGFVTAVLTNDLYGAVARADYVNKANIMAITDWVINYAPSRAWGSQSAVNMWIDNVDQVRTRYAEQVKKEYTWKTLKG